MTIVLSSAGSVASPATSDLVVVIMAGGAGTRLWPASTEQKPKQFWALTGSRTLLQLSFDRVHSRVATDRIIVMTHHDFVPLVRAQLPELPVDNIIAEPERKDTAAAIAYALVVVEARFGICSMAVLTSDHVIGPQEDFERTLFSAVQGAQTEGALYTFGITPTSPATGYGYLEIGETLPTIDGIAHHRLSCFVEKPNRARAEEFLQSNRFLWNAGMFVWRTSSLRNAFERTLPDHLTVLENGLRTSTIASAFAHLPRISIDHGVMEKATDVRMVVARFAWSDVGSFPALSEHLPQDDKGNAHCGTVEALHAHNNLVWCEDSTERVALIGVDNLVVVRVGRDTLVVPKEHAEETKHLVALLTQRRASGRAP